MVKIKMKSLLLGIVLFLLVISVAHAAGSKIVFSDVDVKVGGRTSSNLKNGGTIGEDAEPGDTVEFRIKVQNNFTSAENVKINDITVKTTLEGIDDGSDLEEESTDFDLSAGSEKRVTLKFQVPIEVDESTFDALITAEGEDKNDTDHQSKMRIRLEVNKKSHLLKIIKKTLSPAEVSCSRKNVQIATTVVNIGSEDEEDVTFEISSPALGISAKDNIDELNAEPNEPESRFSRAYSFNVPNDIESGSYPITLRANYDDDRKKAEETVTLTVSDCKASIVATKKTNEETAKGTAEGEQVTIISGTKVQTTTPVSQTEIPPGTVVTQEGFLSSNSFVVAMIIAEVVALIVGIVLVVGLIVRKARA